MPAAAGDGLLGESAAPGGVGGAEEAARPAAACEGSFLPAWVSGVPRERLRDFQHHKRVGHYLIGSRKLGEGSFAKVREGLHVPTGEKVSREVRPRRGRWPRSPGASRPRAQAWRWLAWAFLTGGPGSVPEEGGGEGRLICPRSRPAWPFCLWKGAAWRTPARGSWRREWGVPLSWRAGEADPWRGSSPS